MAEDPPGGLSAAPLLLPANRADDARDWRQDASYVCSQVKVIPCNKSYPHDWERCPYAHRSEGARRRDPRRYPHAGVACPRLKQDGRCAFGDACPYAHSIFEYWLHPSRFRTQLCKEGSTCKRYLCFFAHSVEELRVPGIDPSVPSDTALAAMAAAEAASAVGSAAAAAAAAAAAGVQPGAALDAGLTASPSTSRTSSGAASLAWPGSTAATPPPVPSLQHSLMGGLSPQPSMEILSAAGLRQDALPPPPPMQPPAQNGTEATVQLILQLLEGGELSPDQAAMLLRQLLPAGVELGRQADPLPSPNSQRLPYSDPLPGMSARALAAARPPSPATVPPLSPVMPGAGLPPGLPGGPLPLGPVVRPTSPALAGQLLAAGLGGPRPLSPGLSAGPLSQQAQRGRASLDSALGSYGAAAGGSQFPSPASRLSLSSVPSPHSQQLHAAAQQAQHGHLQQASQLGALQDALGARALQDALSARSELRTASGAGMPQLAGTAAGRLLAAGQGRALLGHAHPADTVPLPAAPRPGNSLSAAAAAAALAGSDGGPAPPPLSHAEGAPLSPEVQQALLAQLLGLGLQEPTSQGQHHQQHQQQ